MLQGYEMRQYPSVKWACTEATYKMEKEDSASRETNDFNLIKMVQEMMSGKGWKNKPENKMFMKLFRYFNNFWFLTHLQLNLISGTSLV